MTLSISGLPRAAACPGAYALPQADTRSVYSDAGDARHAIGDDAVRTGKLEGLPPEVQALIPVGALAASEVRIAYNHVNDTARLLAPGEERDPATEIGGHIDLLVVDGPRLTVVDYKGFEDVGNPDENDQLMGYALAAARAYGVDEVTVVVAYVEEDDGALRLRRPLVMRQVDGFDLITFAIRCRAIIGRVKEQQARAVPDVSEGPQCKYCSAAAACPAKWALIRRLVNGGEADALERMMPLSPEAAGIAYERLGHARNLLKRIEGAIYAIANEQPIPLPSGKWLGKVTTTGNEKLDGDVVYEIVRARHGQHIADTAVVRAATKTRLREALGFVVGKGQVAAAERAVLEEVRAKGGSARPTKEAIEERSSRDDFAPLLAEVTARQ